MTFRHLRFESLESRAMLTVSVNVGAPIGTDQPADLGVNIAAWDTQLSASTTDTLVSNAGMDSFRFNGGSPADTTHFNVASGETIATFATMVAAVGGTGIVSVDYGSGSPQEDAAEVAWLEGSPTSTVVIGSGPEWSGSAWVTVNWGTVGQWATLRATTGSSFLNLDHPAAFTDVNTFEVGNEEYGSWEPDHHSAAHDPATYAQFAATFTTLAKEINPSATVLIGGDTPSASWVTSVMTDMVKDGVKPGGISDHYYGQSPNFVSQYAAYEADAAKAGAGTIPVYACEFNSYATNPPASTLSITQALYVDNALGSLLESGYSGAEIWDLGDNTVNGGSYGIVGNGSGSPLGQLQPSYFAEQLASHLIQPGGTVVSATGSGSLSAYAVHEANGDLAVMLANSGSAVSEPLSLSGFTAGTSATEWQYTSGASALAHSTLTWGGSVSLPGQSVTVIDVSATTGASGSGGGGTITPPATTVSLASSGKVDTFTSGGSAVAVDSGLKVTSTATDLTGAKLTITDYQTGDLLIFNNQNGITGAYANGVLTLSGSATPAQYQVALDSITFSTTSTNTAARTLSIVAADGSVTSNTLAETVDVRAATVTPPVQPPSHHHRHHWG